MGEWNRIRLTCRNNRVVVEINGAVASEIDLDQWPEPNKRPDGSAHKFDVAYKTIREPVTSACRTTAATAGTGISS